MHRERGHGADPLLFSGVRVNEHSLVEDSVVLPGVEIGCNVVIRRSVIDRGCSIADDTKIGVDRHADRDTFHVTDQGITLVTPGMLGQPVFTVR
jgi:glucose-1-phosphate adenylyltransferase